MIVGRGHLDRDLKKRPCCPKIGATTALDEKERLSQYMQFACAEKKENAWKALEDIEDMDPAWVRWVRSSGLLPMVCKAFSTMSPSHRADGFRDTNVVESHNLLGNLLAGTHMHPFDAINELDDLDIFKLSR